LAERRPFAQTPDVALANAQPSDGDRGGRLLNGAARICALNFVWAATDGVPDQTRDLFHPRAIRLLTGLKIGVEKIGVEKIGVEKIGVEKIGVERCACAVARGSLEWGVLARSCRF
jgi:hypothetical protein